MTFEKGKLRKRAESLDWAKLDPGLSFPIKSMLPDWQYCTSKTLR